ncbi:unnamed protein product [Ectocarpus sp. CCAP 1310/34]|nr:unnamed protein product [Ectocarpus sp. CCAP 1310/34]
MPVGAKNESICVGGSSSVADILLPRRATNSPTLNLDIIERVTHVTQRLGEAPEVEEVERAAKGLKNWKAPSPPAELLKIDDDEPFVLGQLHTILVKVWNGRGIPREWKDATIKVLYKKGDRSNCNNYRGISLLSHIGKVPIKIITNRLSAFCEANIILPEEQCGFRPGRSTVDMLFVVRRLQELGRRTKMPIYMCFADLNKAYDSVDRDAMEGGPGPGFPRSSSKSSANSMMECGPGCAWTTENYRTGSSSHRACDKDVCYPHCCSTSSSPRGPRGRCHPIQRG